MFPFCAFAQVEDYLDETLKLSQKEGSNEKLKEYFSGIDARSDTLYAYLYIPGRSPRLEGYVYSFDRLLKHASPGAETVIISVEQDADAARLYNERQGYKADHYIYDEEQRYLDFISINSIGLRGTYVLKVALSSGRLICGGWFLSPLGIEPIFADHRLGVGQGWRTYLAKMAYIPGGGGASVSGGCR